MDDIDRKILDSLQQDGRASQAELSRQVGLTAPSLNERLKKLERSGVIRRYTAILNDEMVGCDIQAFIEVFIDHPQRERDFIGQMVELTEVLECHHITGEASLLLKVKTTDRVSLKQLLLDHINSQPGVRGTKTVVVLETVKEETRLPLTASRTLEESSKELKKDDNG